jgi:hypothetical protein
MSFFLNLYDAVFNASFDDYCKVAKEYATSVAIGMTLTPLIFVTGGTGIVACYTANTVATGAILGATAHYSNCDKEMIRAGINVRLNQPNDVPPDIYNHRIINNNRPLSSIRERPMYNNI